MKSQKEKATDTYVNNHLMSALTNYWIVVDEVIIMNEITEGRGNRYIFKKSSGT